MVRHTQHMSQPTQLLMLDTFNGTIRCTTQNSLSNTSISPGNASYHIPETAMTNAAEFTGIGLHTSLPSHYLISTGLFLPPIAWLCEKNPSRKPDYWHTEHVAKPAQLMECDHLSWAKHGLTDQKVCGSNPASASQLLLSRFGQPGSISALVHHSNGMAARHSNEFKVGRLLFSYVDLIVSQTEHICSRTAFSCTLIRKTSVTGAAEFAGNGFHTSPQSHCLTVSGLFPPFTWLCEKNPSRNSVIRSTWPSQRNLCRVIGSSIVGELFLPKAVRRSSALVIRCSHQTQAIVRRHRWHSPRVFVNLMFYLKPNCTKSTKCTHLQTNLILRDSPGTQLILSFMKSAPGLSKNFQQPYQ
ncbi:hypothetical protein CSKR_108725 [Clonorchis sinensis]|uniref:Uncharacterized protein n=1 Tax=Clonorchis sinensis TaxID=79923 RepID=A0A419PU49_CLOSI|nr:hypothetical protein CSKR_108725 [Clonorchis sinensis]